MPPVNAFVDLHRLAATIHLPHQANLLLMARDPKLDVNSLRVDSAVLKPVADESFRNFWRLADRNFS